MELTIFFWRESLPFYNCSFSAHFSIALLAFTTLLLDALYILKDIIFICEISYKFFPGFHF
jgi:hypothetical protein